MTKKKTNEPAGGDLPKVYTREQIAEILQINQRTIDIMIKDGTIPSVKLGRLIRIPEAALNAFLKDNTRGKAVKAGKEAKNAKR